MPLWQRRALNIAWYAMQARIAALTGRVEWHLLLGRPGRCGDARCALPGLQVLDGHQEAPAVPQGGHAQLHLHMAKPGEMAATSG